MTIPSRFSGLRLASILLAGYALVWIGLEGDLRRVTLLAVWTTAVAAISLIQRLLGGRHLALPVWLATAAVAGLLAGAGAALLTLFLMAVKTGLHAHGPEFGPAEVAAVWAQLPLWSLVGLLLGLGMGLLAAGLANRH